MINKETNKLAKTISALLISITGFSTAQATTITFDNTASNYSGYTGWNAWGIGVAGDLFANGRYTESGLTVTAIYDTQLLTLDNNYVGGNYSNNGTDFGYLQWGNETVTLSAANPFSLQSFNAASIFDWGASNVTLSGFQGGTTAAFTQVFQTLGNNQWSLFSLTGWNNLTSVTITAQNSAFAFDNITINETSPVPEPESITLMGLGAALGFAVSRRKKAAW